MIVILRKFNMFTIIKCNKKTCGKLDYTKQTSEKEKQIIWSFFTNNFVFTLYIIKLPVVVFVPVFKAIKCMGLQTISVCFVVLK